ncbi:hypothetical protein WJX73_007301 [Symbiochloris irregularis]|uniref:Large ribosomal subunit protein uL29m n=1 Tax=Symbiochloris irregularis TaxID=706552 RepID=A0AAW1P2G1_9CHLO
MSLARLGKALLSSNLLQRQQVAAISTRSSVLGLEDFFETKLKEGEARTAGRAWEASDLRRKSWDDLHKLWYVLLKERNMLRTEKELAKVKNERLANPARVRKVQKSMARIKHVLTERAIAEPDLATSVRLRQFINAL